MIKIIANHLPVLWLQILALGARALWHVISLAIILDACDRKVGSAYQTGIGAIQNKEMVGYDDAGLC